MSGNNFVRCNVRCIPKSNSGAVSSSSSEGAHQMTVATITAAGVRLPDWTMLNDTGTPPMFFILTS